MIRIVLVVLLLLLSLLVLFRAATNILWYVSILVTEFSWVFFMFTMMLLLWKFGPGRYHLPASITAMLALVLFALPLLQAFIISKKLPARFSAQFSQKQSSSDETPFRFSELFTGLSATKIPYQTLIYDTVNNLSLDFYHSQISGTKPCIVVIHGGSWAAGDSHQLPELNSELAKWGYSVASINYRLAPKNIYPAPIEDVANAIKFLHTSAKQLFIDTGQFILLGRSAGGQIALNAAYLLQDQNIKGVISFYGPTDMVWGYQNPTNPLVLNSKKIMEDYLGGTLTQVRQQYINSSPTETVIQQAPPTLLIYGENDPLVSPLHGPRLAGKLKAVGSKYFELYLPWATHGFDYTLHGPGGQLSTWAVKNFLGRVCVNK